MGVVVDGARVVTVAVVGGVVLFVPADDNAGFQILKNQNEGSTIGADSGPSSIYFVFSLDELLFTYHKIQYHLQHLQSKTINEQ